MRRVLLGFGSSLVSERRLERPEEVFFLRRDELAAALASREASSFGPLVAKRRGERLRAFAASPPRTLGVPPDPNAELPALVAKLYGVPGSARRQGDRLEGIAASPGLAVGPARIVRGADDFADVHSGDVLVCATTTPAWTPLFGSLAGLVTETGGILSHAAVVAREYALPAVVGAEGATRLVLDGDRLEVDGDAGAVTILREPRPADEAQGAGRVV